MESRHEQWTRESEEHTTTINTQKLINIELENKQLRARNELLEAANKELQTVYEDEIETLELSNSESSEVAERYAGRILELTADVERLRKALREIREGCSFPEDEVQKAVRDRITRELEARDG